MTLAPVVSGNIFNLFYGAVFDAHSVIGKDGNRECDQGLECYRSAYLVTLLSGLAALGVSLVSIWYDHVFQQTAAKAKDLDREA